jgi:predicted RNA-binding protein YlxR (DUF448 family)
MSRSPEQGKHPVRMCIVCRARREKPLLARFVAGGGGIPLADPRQVLPGRGCYVCVSGPCRALFLARSSAYAKRGFRQKNAVQAAIPDQAADRSVALASVQA